MNLNLSGKKALVSGSSQGIGKAIAMELASLGAEITLLARNKEKLESVKQDLDSSFGQKHQILIADFSDFEGFKQVINAHFESQPEIHILINNTGGPAPGPAHTATSQAFVDAFSTHLLCNHFLVQNAVPQMKKVGYGRIINIISTSVKQPIAGLGVSNTIRAAVANWSKTLSLELAPYGITVNNVLPGATNTLRLEQIIENKSKKSGRSIAQVSAEMLEEIPAGRFASPEEIAAAVAFLASEPAAYINGINLPVDGGRTGCL